ncbi:hypothetical protein ACSVIA_20445 [Rhodococcus erythropolis]|uniref:hypothetical protein n=1 Tax=Rhodococcus erythropolis TaxID=1833 RepID=UPI004041B892
MRQPSVGVIVHYQSYGTPGGEYLPEPRAAIITEVHGGPAGEVGVCILNPTGQFFNTSVPFAEEPSPGHWNWPPAVEGLAEVTTAYEAFRSEALQRDAPHLSDCALHNEPATRSLPCDCVGRQAR